VAEPAETRPAAGGAGTLPAVDVVMPFAGNAAAAAEALAALAVLVAEAASVTLVDNSREGAADALEPPAGVRVHAATAIQGSYYARNEGAAATVSPWLLFVDSDCLPAAGMLGRYFEPAPGERTGLLAGAVRAAPGDSRAARYAASRSHIDERFHLESGPYPSGVTANLLVRRAAFDEVGGFDASVRSGGDLDFCWRVQRAGWALEHRPAAELAHRHPDEIPRLLAKARRHAAGRAWVNRLWPGALPRPPIARPFLRGPLVAGWWLLRGDRERAAFKLIDIRLQAASLLGYHRGDNRAPRGSGG